MNTTQTAKKITLATVKRFVRENLNSIFINVRSSFSGMTDGVESLNGGFVKAIMKNEHLEQTLGISGAWFVGSSRDYFQPYEDANFKGIEVSNSCGSFILAAHNH